MKDSVEKGNSNFWTKVYFVTLLPLSPSNAIMTIQIEKFFSINYFDNLKSQLND